ncbi:TetR/AcrR family transcriptional regulator [Cellulosimicrobium sp. Marseille-Q4280]|uniref:TetR/AcrR family transcriptional regulator n=1 Tax=Cellulosimicrobium sp. Marseille-Q4280 TaxID=2937992 RepID=UPI0020411C76|nr:TetR/AcrR family transcriptional regulator [Cellulosimicrobium sp. Marseille-Q4280]
MSSRRADAVRSRERILRAAARADPKNLRLNEIAREAGVGVGTVYRHFATAHALVEDLTLDALTALGDLARAASADPDPWHGFEAALRGVVDLHVEAGGLQAVLLAPEDASPEVATLKAEVLGALGDVLARAQRAGAVRDDVTVAQVERLVCGVEHALRLGSPDDDRDVVVGVLVDGLRARGTDSR